MKIPAPRGHFTVLIATFLLTQCATIEKTWLAGDHHVHSHFSTGWDYEVNPPAPIVGGDAINPIPTNAALARDYGLSWMVTTDHGGPNHSKLNRDQAYPELIKSRKDVPEVIQFYGLELNSPGADHSSLIIPHTHDEQHVLFKLEHSFDNREAFPLDGSRDTEAKMLEALKIMGDLPAPPLVIANHPSRSAGDYGQYGMYEPAELRRWNNTAPHVAVGMAGAPGHQAIALADFGSGSKTTKSKSEKALDPRMKAILENKPRGGYHGYPTLGGFDQLTARVGGFWDSMLGEGRRWWITSNSDFHRHYTQQGIDFYPGEYSKTYVFAEKNHDDILLALRSGRVFVTLGDLVSEVDVTLKQAEQEAAMGGELTVDAGSNVLVEIRVRDPAGNNANNDRPAVNRIDLIAGNIRGRLQDLTTNSNNSTRVAKRFTEKDWTRTGEYLTMRYDLTVSDSMYLRVRGTNTDELEPEPDVSGENPWQDLWFYTNPVFIPVR